MAENLFIVFVLVLAFFIGLMLCHFAGLLALMMFTRDGKRSLPRP